MSRYPKRKRGPTAMEKQLTRSYEEGVILAHTYSKEKPTPDPKGWWMSEKLDGVRAYYNGERLYTRNGNRIHAPDFFLEGFPTGGANTHLDGELFLGRGKFEACAGIVRCADANRAEEWRKLKFLVFDAPVIDGKIDAAYEARVKHSEKAVADAPFAEVVEITHCRGETHLEETLADILSQGGEGLMLREAGSLYTRSRSHSLLKVKSFHDAEARVIGHSRDKKLEGAMGSLVCEMPITGVEFKVGSGIALTDRLAFDKATKLWPVGTVITYGFQGLTDANGKPRFPTYKRRREDKSWEEVVADAKNGADTDTTPTLSSAAGASEEEEEEEGATAAAPPPKKKTKKAPAQKKTLATKVKPQKSAAKSAAAAATDGPPTYSARGVCETESGGKFWEVNAFGAAMTVTYGKVTAKGQSKTTNFGDAKAATREAKKARKQKAAKGYVF